MNCPVMFGLDAFCARRRLLPALMFSLGLVATGLAPIAPAAAQGATQAEPESQPAPAPEEDSDIDTLLNEGEPQPPAAEATPTEPAPADSPAETTPVAQDQPAATRPEPKKGVQLEEIVVTAQKRSEALSKVPLAISAFDQKSMEKVGATSLSKSISLVPNLQSSVGGLAIRGVGTTSIAHAAPTVAMHVDGIYFDDDPRGYFLNWDVERVEVLRGPQGTLYGRNATAGVVNLITHKPSDEIEAFGDVSYGEGNEKLVRFVVNRPLGETLGLRLAASYVRGDGPQKNPVPGESNGAAPDTGLLRLSTRWTPMLDLVWDANVEYMRDKRVDTIFQADWYVSKPDRQTAIVYPSGLSPDEVAPQGPRAGEFGSFADRNGFDVDTYNLRSNLRYELSERWALTWLTGYNWQENRFNTNLLALAQVDHSLRGNNSRGVSGIQSHELDLNFEGDGVHGVAGLYYFRKRSEDDDVLHLWTPTGSSGPNNPPQLATAADMARQSFGPSYDTSQAVFGQLTFDVTEVLRLTGGLRYTQDESRLAAGQTTLCLFGEFSRPDQQPSPTCQFLDQSGAFGGVFGPTPLPEAQQSWNALNWKIIGDYDITPDLLSYATVSTGYKQGAISGRDVEGIHIVKPETNTNYELGLRSKLFDGGANLNVTAFWMDYVDLQVSTSKTIGGVPQLGFANVGKARIRGIETELSWQITERDRIDGYLTYLDAVITHWPDAPDSLRGAAFAFDAAGNQPSAAPKSTFRLGYSRNFDLGAWGTLTPTLATYHSTDAYIQYTNGPQDLNPAYWRSDVFVRYDAPGDKFTVDAFVNNLEDERTKASAFAFLTEATNTAPGGGIQWNLYSAGRVMGLRFGYRF